MTIEDETLVWLRFSGEGLDVRGVPIYELGEVLIALQRIVHKTYLFERGTLSSEPKRKFPIPREERKKLALQIGARARQSDAYALIPFIADAAIISHVTLLLQMGLKELLKYSLKRVLEGNPKSAQSPTQVDAQSIDSSVLTGAIYSETVTITNHVYNIGSVEHIQIVGGARMPQIEPVVFDKSSRDYVRSLADQTLVGAEQTMEGYASQLHAHRRSIDVRVDDIRSVRVRLSDENFRKLRYETKTDDLLRFYGRPLHRFTRDTSSFSEFEADRFEVI